MTSLLDRAITLATEASNGTLNGAQDGAANNEYSSILAEINNIGSTTTYNQQSVFSGNTISIYTGDSSTSGSSIDNLNIRTLSSSSVGDTAGVMSYSSGADNVFIDLSNSGHNAAVSDSLNASACCLKRKCYRRISFVLAQNLTSIAMRLFRASAPFCRILIVVGEAEPGNGGDQPVKE